MISICNAPCISTEEFLHEFPGLPSRALSLSCKFCTKRVWAEQGAAEEGFPRPSWSFRNICARAGSMPAVPSLAAQLQTWLCRGCTAAPAALWSFTADKDEGVREFMGNSNEGSHQMWEKPYFSSTTEIFKNQRCKLSVEKGASQS